MRDKDYLKAKFGYRPSPIYAVQMADDNFGWVLVVGNGMFSTSRKAARQAMLEIKTRMPHQEFRITKYVAEEQP